MSFSSPISGDPGHRFSRRHKPRDYVRQAHKLGNLDLAPAINALDKAVEGLKHPTNMLRGWSDYTVYLKRNFRAGHFKLARYRECGESLPDQGCIPPIQWNRNLSDPGAEDVVVQFIYVLRLRG